MVRVRQPVGVGWSTCTSTGLRPTGMTGSQLCIVRTAINTKPVHSRVLLFIIYVSLTGDWAQQAEEKYVCHASCRARPSITATE